MPIAVVDGNYLLHRCMRAGDLAQLRNRHDKPTGGVMGFLKSLRKILIEQQVNVCTVVFDGGISQRRRALYPEYKGSKYRTPEDPLYEEPDPDPEKSQYRRDFSRQRTYLQHVLPLLGTRVVRIVGWEADDLCYRIASKYHERPGSVLLVSDDLDYVQAVNEWRSREPDVGDQYGSLSVLRPIHDEHITESNFRFLVGHDLSHHLLWRAIVGDGSDKIRGVEGVGKGWLRKIFDAYHGPTAYPFEEFIVWCFEHKTKTVRKIADQLDVVLRNYELMAFHLEPYPDGTASQVQNLLDAPVEADIVKVKYYLTELDLFSITDQIHHWITPFQRLR